MSAAEVLPRKPVDRQSQSTLVRDRQVVMRTPAAPQPVVGAFGLLMVLAFSLPADVVARQTPSIPQWTVGPEPSVSIGVSEGADEYLFASVSTAVLDPRGQFYAGDMGVPTVSVFAPDGTFVRTIGTKGNGPGEYYSINALDVKDDGRIRILDSRLQRLLVFDASGAHVSTTVLNSNGFKHFGAFVGERVASFESTHPGRAGDVGSILADTLRVATTAIGGDDRMIAGRVSAGRRYVHEDRGRILFSYVPFETSAVYASNGRTLVFGNGVESAVTVVSSSGAATRLELAVTPTRVTSEIKSAFRSRTLDAAEEGSLPAWEAYLDNVPFPDGLPYFQRIAIDATDAIWLQKFRFDDTDANSWMVVGADGRLIAEASLPIGFVPTSIGADWMVGVLKDADGFQRVVRYTLDRKTE